MLSSVLDLFSVTFECCTPICYLFQIYYDHLFLHN